MRSLLLAVALILFDLRVGSSRRTRYAGMMLSLVGSLIPEAP